MIDWRTLLFVCLIKFNIVKLKCQLETRRMFQQFSVVRKQTNRGQVENETTSCANLWCRRVIRNNYKKVLKFLLIKKSLP